MGKCIQVLSQSLKYGILYGMLFPLRDESLCFVFLLDLRYEMRNEATKTLLFAFFKKQKTSRLWFVYLLNSNVKRGFFPTWRTCCSDVPGDLSLRFKRDPQLKHSVRLLKRGWEEVHHWARVRQILFHQLLFCPFFQPACVWICAL